MRFATVVRGSLGLALVAFGGGVGSLLISAGPAAAASSSFQAPVYPGDFPDPSILLANGSYWAYSTGSAGRNLQVMTSPDLHSWMGPVEALPLLPNWASPGLTWAPGVIQIGGQYVMYYTVRNAALGMQCLSIAVSSTPGGPFVDQSSGPLVCQTADGGSIDPNPFLDPVSGHRYLIWKSDDNSIGQRSHIWAQQLAPSGLAFAPGTAPSRLLTESAGWQSPTIEGPTMVRYGATYYLFYGANSWSSASSGIGYATSSSLLGAYSNQSAFAPWLGTTGNAEGPQGPMIFQDASGATRLAFAAWQGPVGYRNGGARSLWVANLAFGRRGNPVVG